MKQKRLIVLLAFILSIGGATVVYTCAINSTFRAYLDRRFWQPFSQFASRPFTQSITQLEEESSTEEERPNRRFAGMVADRSNLALNEVWATYGRLASPQGPQASPEAVSQLCAEARAAVAAALQTDLTENENEEMRLVDAKIAMREGEAGNQDALLRAQEKLTAFLTTARTPTLTSEARGWLARVYYLRGEYSSAAKIYLDELSRRDSFFSRASLITSLRVLFPYNGSSRRLADHLDEYFDTPTHALFVVNLVTNPVYFDKEERRAMAAVGKKVITALQNHRDLFRSGAEAEALTLASMRAALYMGDPKAALTYSRLLPSSSAAANSPEFNWMTAASHFLRRDYAAAEAPLLRMRRSKQADDRDRSAAAQALIGVYQKLGRGVDQLHAAFSYHQSQSRASEDDGPSENTGLEDLGDRHWPYAYWGDLLYLLEVQLTDQELRTYLKQHGRSREPIWQTGRYGQSRHRSAPEIVEYTLAVRHTRREEYREAAAIYRKLGSWPRAVRMQQLAKLHGKANDPTQTSLQRLEARYAYAAFLADHPNGVFFHDMARIGCGGDPMQLGKESYPGNPIAALGLTRQEWESFAQQERRVCDEHEERWRAYKILATVVDEAGPSQLGRRAAKKAFNCLVRINTRRFGREPEIKEALRVLANWTRKHSVQQTSLQDLPR